MDVVKQAGREAFGAKITSWHEIEERYGAENLTEKLLSNFMLQVLDEKWKDHLYDLDQLRNAIQYRAWGQKDPLIEYKREAFELFEDLINDFRRAFPKRFSRLQVQVPAQGPVPGPRRPPPSTGAQPIKPMADVDMLMPGAARARQALASAQTSGPDKGDAEPARPTRRSLPKVGRNDPCPCGSGKKYKKCHGVRR